MPATSYTSGPGWEAVFSYLLGGITVIGIDEVGRGAWAGPVTAGAVIFPPKLQIPGLNDSKKVPAPKRLALDKLIRRHALAIGIGWVGPDEVDEHGLSWAVTQSGLRALVSMKLPTSDYIVVLDGRQVYLSGYHPAIALVKADASVTPVSAASVVAKVARDRYMQALSNRYPNYGFERHVGYGTKIHRDALIAAGPSPAHRKSVQPVARSIVTP